MAGLAVGSRVTGHPAALALGAADFAAGQGHGFKHRFALEFGFDVGALYRVLRLRLRRGGGVNCVDGHRGVLEE